MATLTTIANIKLIAKNEPRIIALDDADPLWALVLADVGNEVTLEMFGTYTEIAQRYLAAHYVSISLDGVVGELAGMSIGGVSRQFTVPYLNRKDIFGATQFGMEYTRLRDKVTLPFASVIAAC